MKDLIITASAIAIEADTGKKRSNGAPEDPTSKTYSALNDAFAHFNKTLFNGRLPACLITLRNHGRSYGYFSDKRFADRDGTIVTDEIALNPKYFTVRDLERTLSTLVHEMCHLAQFRFGTPSKNGYHNKEWAALMEAVGLMPSDTGEPSGKRTGSRVSHYIIEGGPFALSCADLLAKDFIEDLLGDIHKAPNRAKREMQNQVHLPRTAVRTPGARRRSRSAASPAGGRCWRRGRARNMSKRLGKHKRRERDFYPSPYKAVLPLLPQLAAGATFYECCAGDGRLIDHLAFHGFRCTGASDIRPMRGDIHTMAALDLTELDCEGADLIITNPPHDRPLMHALIDHLRQLRPTWLLLPADWIFTRQAGPYLAFCKVIVPIGRMKIIEGSRTNGFDNYCWARFEQGQTDNPRIANWSGNARRVA